MSILNLPSSSYPSTHTTINILPCNIGNLSPSYYMKQVNYGGVLPLSPQHDSKYFSNQGYHVALPSPSIQENMQSNNSCRTCDELMPYT